MFLKTQRRAKSPCFRRSLLATAIFASVAMPLSSTVALADSSATPFERPLFSDSLFSSETLSSSLSGDMKPRKTASASASKELSVAQQVQNSQVDMMFMQQLQRVAHYLNLYGVRNGSRFPGLPNDEGNAAQVQLNELVPSNPYNPGYTQGSYQGLAAWTNPNGSPATGSPVWADSWTEHLQAAANNRVILSMDYSLNKDLANQYAQHPPSDWSGQAPGTINCIGNGQGFFIVWGAGRDGKPIKDPTNGLTYIQAGSTTGLVNDQIAPNAGGIP